MPKQFKTYTRFEGGLNTKTNARSIQENELAQANNVIVDEFGMIKSCGKATDNGTNYTNPSLGGAQQAGYGLFQAVMDYKIDGTNTPTVFTFLADPSANGTPVDISEDPSPFLQGVSFDENEINHLGISYGGTSGGAIIYDIVDGVVRSTDVNFGAQNVSRWYGFIKRKLWKDTNKNQLNIGGGSTQSIDAYVSADSGLYQPFYDNYITGFSGPDGYPVANGAQGVALAGAPTTSGTLSSATTFSLTNFGADYNIQADSAAYNLVDVNSTSFVAINSMNASNQIVCASAISGSASDVYYVAPDAGFGFNIEVTEASGGALTAGTFEFAQTFIYDEHQESMPTPMVGTKAITSNYKATIKVIATHGYGSRISGGRIYMRDSTLKGEWELATDISFEHGCRSSLEGDYTGWAAAYSEASVIVCSVVLGANNLDTFETINGYSSSIEFNSLFGITKGYKTSTVSNRRRFIANVKHSKGGFSVHSPDRIMYSEINKFDTILSLNTIDVGINDGEEFVKLEGFNDRLLAFKNKTLYIINIAGGSDTQWFLEETKPSMGVDFHAAVVKTPFGICWVNKNGLYIYDGSKIINLQTKILESQWESFVNSDTMIGYEPTHKHLVVIRDADDESTDNGDAYVYSFITNSFTFVEDLIANNVKSNPITDIYNKLTMAVSTNDIISYDGEPDAGTTFDIILKDDDFGLPNISKKIYGVTVEYSSSAASSNGVKYIYTSSSGVRQDAYVNLGSLSDTGNSGEYDPPLMYVDKFDLSTPISVSSFQVKLDLGGNSVHKVNNVAVEYRPIHKRIT